MAKASTKKAPAVSEAPAAKPVDPFLAQLIGHAEDIIASLKNLENPGQNQDPYLARLDVWEGLASLQASVKDAEADFRRQLFQGAFPNPTEGTNVHKLPDGREIVGKHVVTRKIDEAALPAVIAAMRARGVANTDKLVRYKPELAKREWNSLSDESKLIFSPAVIADTGMPQLEVRTPKARGRKA